MSCDLCNLRHRTRWHYQDDVCVVFDCDTCLVPVLVLRRHTTEPTAEETQHLNAMMASLSEQWGGHWDMRRRKIPDHWHAHLRFNC